VNLAELHEVLLELVAREFEVEAADENFALRVRELNGVFRVFASRHVFGLHHLAVGVRFLDLLSVVAQHEVVVVVASMVVSTPTQVADALAATLVVVCRLNVDSFVHDDVALALVDANDPSLHLLSLFFVCEAQEHEAKPAAALRKAVSHHYGVLNLAKLLEVALQVLF